MWSIFFLSLGIALGCSFFCSLCEAALLSLTPGQIENMAKKNPARARVWRQYRERVDTPISAILILNTSAHTIGATVAGAELSRICDGDSWWMTAFSISFTYAMLQFTEILPKNLGVRFNTTVAAWFTTPLSLMIAVFRPVIWFVHFVNRPFETKDGTQISPLDELSALVQVGRNHDLLDTFQVNILEKGAVMRQRTAREVMVPVDQVTFLHMDQAPQSVLETIAEDPHTRFPILQRPEDPNSVVGYLNIKDIFAHFSPSEEKCGCTEAKFPVREDSETLRILPAKETSGTSALAAVPAISALLCSGGVPWFSLAAFRRNVRFVPETMPLNSLLKLFVRERAHVLIVQDAEEKMLGLITVEDLLEDLLDDDLKDEFDAQLPTHLLRTGYGIFTFGGGVPLETVSSTLEISIPLEESARFQNLSEWLLAQMETVPRVNHKIVLYGWQFVIRRVRREQIFDVLTMRAPEN